jgi:hypothetical protein
MTIAFLVLMHVLQVQAFSVAMKHALRGEAGPFYTDLYSLIAFLPKYVHLQQQPLAHDSPCLH